MSVDLATLAIEVDARDAADAAGSLDRLTAAAGKAERATDKLGDEAAQSGKQMQTAAQAAAEMAAKAQASAAGAMKTGDATKLARHHVQNLAYQFQDLGMQLTMAAQSGEPFKMAMMAIMQQGGQITQIMSQAGLSFGGLAAQMGAAIAPFAPIIAAVGLLAGGVALLTDEINKDSAVHVTWSDTLLGIYDMLVDKLTGAVSSAFEYFGTTAGEVWQSVVAGAKWLANSTIANLIAVPKAIYDSWGLIPAGVADIFLSAVNGAIDAINKLIKSSVDGVNGFVKQANTILDQFGLGIGEISAPQIAKMANSYAGAGAKLGHALAGSIAKTMATDFVGDFGDELSPYAQHRARERMKKDAEKAGKDAAKAAKKAVTDEMRAADLAAYDAKWMNGLYNDAVKDAIKNLDADWTAFINRVNNKGQAAFDELRMAEEEARKEAERLNDQLRDMIGLLGDMGGVGKVLGTLGGILTGNTSAIGGKFGSLLNIGLGTELIDGKEVGKTIGTELSKVFNSDGAFGKAMQSIIKGATTGMAAADAFGLKGGTGGQLGSAIGGALGEKLGSKFLSKGMESIAKGLGDFAGPLGSIVGGILGNVLGGLLGSVKWGKVSVTSGGVSASTGNSNASERAAVQAGGNVFEKLNTIAEALGGMVGDFGSITVGVRDGKYRVNTTGTSLKKSMGATNFGKDGAEEAIAFAIQTALDRGAVQGIRASTQNILKATDDLEKNVSNALRFEGVFSDLEAITNPLSAAFHTIAKEADQLREIFTTAGASAEEYAQLEQLVQEKRKAAIVSLSEEFNDRFYTDAEKLAKSTAEVNAEMMRLGLASVTTKEAFRSIVEGLDLNTDAGVKTFEALMLIAPKFADVAEAVTATGEAIAASLEPQRLQLQLRLLEAQGKELEALALTRQMERDATDASLRPLLDQIYAAEDQAKANDAAAAAAEALAATERAVAQEREGLETRLLQLQGDTAALRARELAALDPANRALQEQIFALQDQQAAADAAKAAEEELAKQRTALSDRLFELTATETEMRAKQLSAIDPTLRAMQEQVWALEDAAKAADAAKQAEEALANQRAGLEQRLFDLTATVAEQRERELAALDPSNRAILERIYAIEDEKAATEAATKAAEDAAAAAAKVADERAGLERQLLQALGDTAAIRAQELATLDPSNRALQERLYALEDEAAATEAATKAAEEAAAAQARIADERAGLERRILELTGQTTAIRELELAALDPSNRALQQRIYALEDEATAADAARAAADELAQQQQAAAEQAARVAEERAGLERQILDLTGQTAAIRALELAALDPGNRALQERIYALQDEQAAAEQAAQAAADLAAVQQRAADEVTGLQRALLEAQGNVAAIRALDLAGMLSDDARAIQQQIWAIEDARVAADALAAAQEDAARAAAELADRERAIADERTGLLLRLLDAQGEASAALAMRREQELAATDASNRAILEQIYAAEDAATAAAALAEAQAEQARQAEEAAQAAQRIADERAGLERRILELQGDTVALRALELASLDPANRALQLRIYAMQDEQTAAEQAAQAAEALAAEQQRAAEEAAALAQRIADERYGLETQVLQLQGKTVELRARELALLDPTNRALQEQIWAIEDQQAASEAAAKAAQDAADAQAELARQQQEAAQAAEQLRKAGVDLQIRYFETLGDTAQATALKRQEELAATDESLRGLLRQIYALEDAKAAEDAYAAALQAKNSRVDDARNALSAAYEREASALQSTIDKFRDFGDALRDFRAGLFAAETGTAASYRQLQMQFIQTSALAATGDAAALGGLAGAGQSFLDVSRAQASSLVQYQRDVAMVARSVDTAIGAADDAVDYAQLQLDALKSIVGGYIDLNENVLTVAQAIQQLREAEAEVVVPATVEPIVNAQETQTQAIKDSNQRLEQRIGDLEDTLSRLLSGVNDKLNSIDRREQKYDRGDFKAVGNDSDTPLTVEVLP